MSDKEIMDYYVNLTRNQYKIMYDLGLFTEFVDYYVMIEKLFYSVFPPMNPYELDECLYDYLSMPNVKLVYDCFFKFINDNHPFYKEIHTKYQAINKTIFDNMMIFNTDNPMFLAGVYAFLLYKGYLSYNQKFKKESIIYTFSRGLNSDGFNIPLGFGVCRNVSKHFKDVLEVSDAYKIEILFLYTYKNLFEILKKYIVNQQIPGVANHAINAFIYKDKACYIYLMNLLYFRKVNDNSLKIYRENEGFLDMFKKFPISMSEDFLFKNNSDHEYTKEILSKQNISFEEVDEIFIYGMMTIKNNLDICDKIYKENEMLYQELKEDITRYENISNKCIRIFREDIEKKMVRKL